MDFNLSLKTGIVTMEDTNDSRDKFSLGPDMGGKLEEEDDEFRSCCGDHEEWRDSDEMGIEGLQSDIDEFSLQMFFKGVSVSGDGDPGLRISGIGVVMEGSNGTPIVEVQKKLDFYVEDPMIDYLALMDGLLEAPMDGIRRIFAYTDSKILCDQIAEPDGIEDQLLAAFIQRIIEHTSKLESFVLKFIPSCDLKRPLQLAREAVGFDDVPIRGCPICCEKQSSKSITLNCSNKFCHDCITTYVDGKICTQCLSLSMRASSSSQSENSSVECPMCHRFICIDCDAPWHPLMSCEEYQNLPPEERDAGDITLHRLAQDRQWRRCQHCQRMIELTHGCYHMTCWCGHEFCYNCGEEYIDGTQTCECVFIDEEDRDSKQSILHSNQDSEPWNWNAFDAYTDQERSQLALLQRFLAGGFGLGDHHHPCQSPPHCSDSYMETIKDLHQLPWLERFISVISDYHEDYIR
ncbi:hypothetical protein QJS10_CPA01g00787 [Acorus calamus]|uniref:RBR-type E3 ubiquitin transferase n=1 Tax=Acorus calamus TaxID=4465 RepID=A0AAV9FJK2_ACOCL|nr:hypothetical protein QJS10_CPA01g00787 [Acorus calamus]